MRPRTTASAVCSPASRSPSRPSIASRTAVFTSCVSAGSGVSLSNGRIATVRTLGSPPPLKWYKHPAATKARALATTAPERRRKLRHGVHRHDPKLKARRSLRKVDAGGAGQRARVEPRGARRHHLACPPPLRRQHAVASHREHVLERVCPGD